MAALAQGLWEPNAPKLPAATLSHPAALSRRPRRACERPRLSVVLVNYWNWDDIARLVRQLRASSAVARGEAEIVVVDNHSPPHRLIPRLRRAPGVSLRRWKSNRGFARAVNEGSRLSQGDWLLLLNPDTTVPAGFLDDVLARADSLAPRAGVVGFRLHDEDGARQPSTGRFPNLLGTLTRLVLPRHLRKYTPPPVDGLCEVDWVTGCCLLVRREVLAQLGGLDPDFFLYYEDVDLCRRARRAGWSVWFDPSAGVIHHRPLHSRRVPPHLRLVTRHALLTYARKHWPAWQLPLLGGIVRLEAAARRLLARCRGDAKGERTFTELGRLVGEVLRGEPGRAWARLTRVIRAQEQHLAATFVHRDPLPQPPRPLAALPEQRPPARACGHGSAGGR